MTGKRKRTDCDLAESLKVIFGEEIGGLSGDGFEGSDGEYRIFASVFYRGAVEKGHFVSGSNFNGFEPIGIGSKLADRVKSMNALSPVNCDHSIITSHSSVKNLAREDSFAVNGNSSDIPRGKSDLVAVSSCAQECCSSQVEPGPCSQNIKQIKSSHDGNSDHDKKESGSCLVDTSVGRVLVHFESSKETAPRSLELDLDHSGQLITIPIVDSSVHGIILHHYPLKQIMSHPKLLSSSEASNVNTSSQDGRDAKEVVQDKVITSPVSQESSVSKLLVTDLPITVEDKPEDPLCAIETVRPRCRESLLLSLDSVKSTWKSGHIAELRQRLRRHIRHFLVVAGWKIETRPRRDRPYEDSVYLAPGCGRTFYSSLPKAWEYCGKSLSSGITYLLQEENKREWVDVIEFWSDLSDTLARIEKEVQQMHNSISLNDWWALLDPFVTMVLCGRLGRFKEQKATGGILDYNTEKASFSSKRKKSILGSKCHGNENKDMVLIAENIESFGNVSGSLDGNVEPTPQSDNMCTPLQVLPAETHACLPLVGESMPEMVDSIKASKKEGAYGRFSNFGELGMVNGDCHLELGSGGSNKKLFCDVESEKLGRNRKTSNGGTMKSLPNREVISPRGDKALVEMLNSMPSKSTANDSCNIRDMGSMERNLPKSRGKRIMRPLTRGSFTGRVSSFYSHLEGFVKNTSAQNLTTPNLEASISKKSDVACVEASVSHNLKLVDGVSCDETVDCMVEEEAKSIDLNMEINGVVMHMGVNETLQERNLISQPVGKLLIRDQMRGELEIEQQMPFLPSWEQQCKEEVPPSGRKKVFPHRNMSDTNNASHVQQELASSGYRRSPRNVVINFRVDNKAEDNPECLAHRDLPSFSQRGMVSAVGGANKSHTKSKKLSVIDVCKPCDQCNMHNLSTPQKVEEKNSDCVNLDRSQENITCNKSKEGEKCHADTGRNENPKMVCAVHLSECQYESKSDKKSWGGSGDFREPAVVADEGKSLENTVEAPLVCVNDKSSIPQTRKKAAKAKNCKKQDETGRKRLKAYKCQIDDDELLIAAIIKSKKISSNSKCSKLKARNPLSNSAKKLKNQKGGCRLLPRGSGKGGKHDSDVDWSSLGTRTVLSWLIDSGVLSENEIVQYRSTKDDSMLKDGWVTRDGLLCKCCNRILSISEFKAHAGSKLSRPSLNLFLERGKSFTLCQLQAWSAEYKARKGGKRIVEVDEVDLNDDTCGLCGDGGDLICCDNCPSTFHQACLTSQELPEGSWYCPYCICEICGDVVSDKEASGSLVVLTCAQCEHKYHKTCVEEKGAHEGRAVSEAWFCGHNCREVYSGLHSRVGVLNHIGDGFSWTLLRCMHGDQKVPSAQRFALMAECNTKLAVALTIMEECFLPMVDPRTGIDMIPHVLYNWGSNFARLNYQGFYTVVLEKGDKLISVASIRIHGVTVAEMPLIATCSENRRQGMCRRLMNAIEEMLASYKVERLVISAIPALVNTWTFGFGYKLMEEEEREKFSKINFMVFPGTTLLQKRLYGAQSLERVQTEIDLNQAVGESSINVTAEKASAEVFSEDLVEIRNGENLSQLIGREIGDLPLNLAKVKPDETMDLISRGVSEGDLFCILDRKDLNTLMEDLNLGPKTNSEVGSNGSNRQKGSSARDSKRVASEESHCVEYAVAARSNAKDKCCSLVSVTVDPTAKITVETVEATRDVAEDGNFDRQNVLERGVLRCL